MMETDTRQTQQTRTVLIVEDDIEIGYFLAQALKEEQRYQVVFATDGFQALKMVRTLIPDLVLLDYLLPRVNGLEVAEQLRASDIPQLRQVPIILMSANMPKHISPRQNIQLLHKPFDLDVLLDQVKRLLTTNSTV